MEIKTEGEFQYVEQGEGQILLLLHGLFGALSNWKATLDHFSPNYKVVIPLMPMFSMPLIKLSVKGLANYIHDFVEHKGYEEVTLLGNSLGGHVGLVYVTSHPEKVKAMMLTGSSGLYENAMGGTYPKRGDKEYIRNKVAVTFYDPAMATDDLVQEVFDVTKDRGKVLRILTMAKSAIRHNMRKEIENIKIPVCLIWGKDDQVTPPHVGEEFNRLLPNSELHWIEKCGHAAMMERPEEFNKALDPFLERVLKSKGAERSGD